MDEIVEKLRADYDAVNYEAWEHFHAHPDRIAVVAALRGLVPPAVNQCRVLEIACAQGGNLLPMAEQMPESRFVGIDLSPRQIEAGSALVRELGLTNIELRCQDLMEFPEDAGTFDYIIAHGFYSWVPEAVRAQLMTVCRRHLSANGLAFISYNTFPGWRSKGVIRDMMLYHARNAGNPAERVKLGREMVQLVAEEAILPTSYREMVREFNKSMPREHDTYLLHDYMELVNEPVYLTDFVRHSEANGLSLLGDANPNDDMPSRVSPALRDRIAKLSADPVERDQYMDFLTNRTFRQAVLCHAEAARMAQGNAVSNIRKLYVAGNPKETAAGRNSAGQEVIRVGTEQDYAQLSDPRPIAAVRRLCAAWPSAVSFTELNEAAFALSAPDQRDRERCAAALANMLVMCHSLNLVELWTRPTDHISAVAGERPKVTRLARWQALHHSTITTLRHGAIKTEEVGRRIIPLLDGTRNAQELADELVRRNEAKGIADATGIASIRDRKKAKELIDEVLVKMASLSLLMT